MNHAEYFDMEGVLDAERQALAAWCKRYGAPHTEAALEK
jgi:hypothetical protein